MFSLDRFYYILHDNLISRLPNGESMWCYPFGTYNGHHVINVLTHQTQIFSVIFMIKNHIMTLV